MSDINIKQFPLTEENILNRTIVICGDRCSGRTHIAKEIISIAQSFMHKSYVVSFHGVLQEYTSIPTQHQKTDADQLWMENIAKEQRIHTAGFRIGDITVPPKHIFIIFDCISSIISDWFEHNEIIRDMFVHNRFYNITTVLITDSEKELPAFITKNADYKIFTTARSATEVFHDARTKKPNKNIKKYIDTVFDTSKNEYKKLIFINDSFLLKLSDNFMYLLVTKNDIKKMS